MAYTPAGNTTSTGSLRHLATVYYNRTALDQLMRMFHFREVSEEQDLPLKNGRTMQWFRYTLLGANTSAASEGTVGTSLTLDTNTISTTVNEYADFITLSSLLNETAIDPIAENAAIQLAYRAAFSVDTIVRTELDSTTTPEVSTLGANLSISDFRKAVSTLQASDVRPREGMDFVGIMHPYVKYDLIADNSAGGFIDVMRYAQPGRFLTGEVGKVEGVRLLQTTNVKTSGSAPNVLYYTYVVGKGAIGAVSLSGRGPSKVSDPSKQRFKINTGSGGPSLPDPTGTIGGWVSYRFVFAAKLLDSTTFRYKMIKADSSII